MVLDEIRKIAPKDICDYVMFVLEVTEGTFQRKDCSIHVTFGCGTKPWQFIANQLQRFQLFLSPIHQYGHSENMIEAFLEGDFRRNSWSKTLRTCQQIRLLVPQLDRRWELDSTSERTTFESCINVQVHPVKVPGLDYSRGVGLNEKLQSPEGSFEVRGQAFHAFGDVEVELSQAVSETSAEDLIGCKL
eukprot:s1622_g27.t1